MVRYGEVSRVRKFRSQIYITSLGSGDMEMGLWDFPTPMKCEGKVVSRTTIRRGGSISACLKMKEGKEEGEGPGRAKIAFV